MEEVLKSVEIIYLESKAIGKAKDLSKSRNPIALIVLGSTLLALGGMNETSIHIWEGASGSWKEAAMSLNETKSQFSAFSYSDMTWYNGSVHHELNNNMSEIAV